MRLAASRLKAPSLGLVAAIAIALAAPPLPAQTAPVLRVRGRATLEVDPVRRLEEGVAISGQLRDRATGEGIPRALLRLHFGESTKHTMTDDEGRFELHFPSSGEPRDLRVVFPGNPDYPAEEYSLAGIDERARPLELSLALPEATSAEDESVTAELRSESEGRAVDSSPTILAGPEPGSLTPVKELTTRGGRAEVSIPLSALGPPGRALVAAVAEGTAGYDEARTRAEILITSATDLELSLDPSEIRRGEPLVARGRLVDGRGTPVSGAFVSIGDGTRELAAATTDDEGAFATAIPSSEIGEGEAALSARFEPDVPWLEASRAGPRALVVRDSRPIPLRYTLAAFGLAGALALAFAAGRILPSRRPKPERGRGESSRRSRGRQGRQEGALVSGPRRLSALRRRSEHALSGRAVDAITGAPIPGAGLRIRGEEERELEADEKGSFATRLSAGTWRIEVLARGYVRERFEASAPHRGELCGIEVQLWPVREWIFARYRDAAESLLPRPELWGIWTPRQIVDHVRASRPAPALAALTERVEEAYFSSRTPQESEIADIESGVAAATSESAPA